MRKITARLIEGSAYHCMSGGERVQVMELFRGDRDRPACAIVLGLDGGGYYELYQVNLDELTEVEVTE